jgi:hypothetical protein
MIIDFNIYFIICIYIILIKKKERKKEELEIFNLLTQY